MNANKITNRQTICDVLMAAAETDKDVTVLCSDSRGSGSMTPYADKYPQQFVEIGIAEQNLVSIAAGMATCGKKAYAVSPASFLSTRSYEQIKVDVAYSATNVKLIGISGGISYGALGMTHHSLQDIAALSALPGMRVYMPSDRFRTAALIKYLLKDSFPAYVRVSRTPSYDLYSDNMELNPDKAVLLRKGGDVALIACGEMVKRCLDAADILSERGISAAVLDICGVKPIDMQAIIDVAKGTKAVVTVEEHSPFGGLGSIVAQIVSSECPEKVVNMSLPDGHIIAGTNEEAFAYYSLTGEGIAAAAERALK